MKLILFICTFFLSFTVHAQNLVIKNVNIVDVENGKIRAKQDVVISNGVIQSIVKSKGRITSDHVDGTDKYLMPGLIDAHIHLFQSGGLYTRPDAIDLQHIIPYSEEREWLYQKSGDILSRYLSQGITSVIDLGGPMYNLAIKDSLNHLENTAHVYMTGPLISTYIPKELNVKNAPIEQAFYESSAERLVKEQVELNPDFIKIWFVITRPQDALTDYPIVKAAVDEAKRHDKPVAIHAKEIVTAKMALELGVDFLVHSVVDLEIDNEFIDLLKSSNAVYCPTLQVSSNYDNVIYGNYKITDLDYKATLPKALGSIMDIRHLEDNRDMQYYKSNKDDILGQQAKKDNIAKMNLKRIIQAGIPIALGTDAGNIGTMHASSYFHEIDLFKSVGMSNEDILKSATIHAARAIKKEREIGSVANHKKADLLLLNANPFDNLDNLEDINLILKNGKVVHQDKLINQSPEDIAQRQLNAYNGHNLNAFMELYADDVKIYNFPNELSLEGKDNMRKSYAFIENSPSLHAELVNRSVIGQTVIDHERVTFDPEKPPLEVIAVYTISNNKISTVHFIRQYD